ncbi:MAG TPA: hypothetical protein VLT90_02045 [Terriglobales bacterium]|nr:hypothetical protein [Terriglobales bacterium]
MRLSWILPLVVAVMCLPAAAQKYQKPKAKPTYSEERSAKGSARAAKPAPSRDATAQELHRVEQSSSKVPGSRRGDSSRAPRTVVKAEKEERNPPIQATGSRSRGQGGKGKTSNSYKGRLRHKGSHR